MVGNQRVIMVAGQLRQSAAPYGWQAREGICPSHEKASRPTHRRSGVAAPPERFLVVPTGNRATHPGYTIQKWHRSWKLLDPHGELVCLTVYKKGAQEVIRRLERAA